MKNVFIFTVISIFLIKKCFSNDAHTNLISLLEMNYPIEFTFEQKYNSDKINGWMVIAGNGMARTEFAPPNNNLIVADGKWIMFYDPEIDRTTYIPLDKGIFKAFLKPTALIEDKIFQIRETEENTYLSSTPNYLAKSIFTSQQKRRDVIYVKWYWRYILFIVNIIPEFIFKRTNI